MMENEDGKKSVKLDLIPVGSWDGWLVVAERKAVSGDRGLLRPGPFQKGKKAGKHKKPQKGAFVCPA